MRLEGVPTYRPRARRRTSYGAGGRRRRRPSHRAGARPELAGLAHHEPDELARGAPLPGASSSAHEIAGLVLEGAREPVPPRRAPVHLEHGPDERAATGRRARPLELVAGVEQLPDLAVATARDGTGAPLDQEPGAGAARGGPGRSATSAARRRPRGCTRRRTRSAGSAAPPAGSSGGRRRGRGRSPRGAPSRNAGDASPSSATSPGRAG